jgi:hypothetical protein
MIFSTDTVMPEISNSISLALIPIIVNIQLASAVATRSEGEKRSPAPWLSTGAQVCITWLERRWVATVLRSPS